MFFYDPLVPYETNAISSFLKGIVNRPGLTMVDIDVSGFGKEYQNEFLQVLNNYNIPRCHVVTSSCGYLTDRYIDDSTFGEPLVNALKAVDMVSTLR